MCVYCLGSTITYDSQIKENFQFELLWQTAIQRYIVNTVTEGTVEGGMAARSCQLIMDEVCLKY